MSSLTQLHKLLWADGFTYKVEPGAKSRDLLSNGGAGSEASLPGRGCPRSFSFPKRLGDDALAYLLSIKELAKTTILKRPVRQGGAGGEASLPGFWGVPKFSFSPNCWLIMH
jgi:hypothetical protein